MAAGHWLAGIACYLLLLAETGLCCGGGGAAPPRPRPERTTSRPVSNVSVRDIDLAKDEEQDEDETASDIDHEADFDLICDGHVEPERVKRTPDVIIFGSKKGGTRALIEFLKLHPKIKAAGPEIHYFDKHYEKGLDWYVSNLRAVVPGSGEVSVEKTPGYFHTEKAPERVFEMDPNIKLLLILRNPVKRLISDYNQFRSRYLDQGKEYPSLEDFLFTSEGEIDVSYPALQRSIYHLHILRWLHLFQREQIHLVDGEKFIREPWQELQKVEVFLNLTSVITQDNFFFNSTKGYYCSKDFRSHGAWTCTREKCLGRSKGRPKPPVAEETTARMTEFFAPHNKMFYDMVGQEFEWPY